MAQFLKSVIATAKLAPGAPPGIERLLASAKRPEPGSIPIRCIDFTADELRERDCGDLDEVFATERLGGQASSRWIDIQGINPFLINQLKEQYDIHTLAAEDALHPHQRPKAEDYGDSLYLVLRMLRLQGENLVNEQVSFFFMGDTLITVQETPGDVWDTVRARISKPNSRFRQHGCPYLLYALIDSLVDNIFPLLESYFERLDTLEETILEEPTVDLHSEVHALKRELTNFRQAVWPIREVVSTLRRDEIELLPPEVETFLGDVHDHAAQANETVELYREAANSLQDLLMAAASNRMNEVMKALTIMASLFLPLTFFAGVYGMNFEHIPELGWRYAYPAFWFVCIVTVVALLIYFNRKSWIGK